VSGSCPILRRTALEQLSGTVGYVLDPWYFTYGEDVDVMIRLHLLGWRVRFIPDLRAWHIRSASTAVASRFYQKPDATQVRHFRNRLATIFKTYPKRVLWTRAPALAFAELATPAYLLLRRPRSVLNWVRAWKEIWVERARLRHDRRRIQGAAAPEFIARLGRLLAQI
ncbi:MAG: glycosyltransferase family 2 protein, partial [Gemmatimonadales bacterium]